MPTLTVEKPLRDKLGEEASESLLRLVNQSVDQRKHEMLEFIEEKFERRLTEEIGKVNARITDETGNLRLAIAQTEQRLDNRITAEISKVNERMTTEMGKLDNKIERTRADIIKWMFIFWIGQIGVIMGLLFAFFK